MLGEATNDVAKPLQETLICLTDLALIGKQLHWTITGDRFVSIHEKLDELVELAREASDEVAERLSTLGIAPDARAATVASASPLSSPRAAFTADDQVVSLTTDLLFDMSARLRQAISAVADHDPISEDMLIAITAKLESMLWMFRAMQ